MVELLTLAVVGFIAWLGYTLGNAFTGGFLLGVIMAALYFNAPEPPQRPD